MTLVAINPILPPYAVGLGWYAVFRTANSNLVAEHGCWSMAQRLLNGTQRTTMTCTDKSARAKCHRVISPSSFHI